MKKRMLALLTIGVLLVAAMVLPMVAQFIR